jgi:hypothetical protein
MAEEHRNELTFAPDGAWIPPAPPAPVTGTANVIPGIETPNQAQAVSPVKSASARRGAKRFHADNPFVLSLLLVLIATMAASSFYVSFFGIYEAAEWAVGPNPPLQFAVPLMLDVAIIAFTLSLFIERERGEKVWGTWVAIGAFTLVSTVANVAHTFVVTTATDQLQLIIGAVISGGAPLLLAVASDKIAIKVFKTAKSDPED